MLPLLEFPHHITCIDKDGVDNKFVYNIEETRDDLGRQKWVFRVVPPEDTAADWFEFAVVKIDKERGKIFSMDNNGEGRYKAKGIPDKMLNEAAYKLDLDIISSTNNPNFKLLYGEQRTPDADKVWKRQAKNGIAEYDERTDMYTYVPKNRNL